MNVNGRIKVDWRKYRLVMESMTDSDGGGFRVYHPTLGFSVYGVGDTKSEAINSLITAREHYEEFIAGIPGYQVPAPTAADFFNRPDGEPCDDSLPDTAYAA